MQNSANSGGGRAVGMKRGFTLALIEAEVAGVRRASRSCSLVLIERPDKKTLWSNGFGRS
jgi:hypothetical protein